MNDQIRILLFEDDIDHQVVFKTLLGATSFSGARVVAVRSFSEGASYLLDDGVDIVFLDLSLIDSSAERSLAHISDIAPSCPVVVLTSLNDKETILSVVAKGADDCLLKSELTPYHLERTIRYSLDRWQLRTKLLRSEENYHDLFDHTPNFYMIVDATNGLIVECNKTFLEKLGFDASAVIGKSVFNFYHPGSVALAREMFNEFLLTDGINETKLRVVSSNGSVLDVLCKMSAARDALGNITFVRTVWVDITSEENTNRALRKSKLQYQSLVENLHHIVYRCRNDDEWTMVFVNDAIEAMTGYPASDFIENRVRSFNSIIHPDDRMYVASKVQEAVIAKRPFLIEYRLVSRYGDTVWVKEHGENVIYGPGEAWLEGVIGDITSEKLSYERLQKVLDAQSSIVFVCDGKQIHFANKMFYRFFGVKSLNDFFTRFGDITDCFVEHPSFFHLGKMSQPRTEWIKQISVLPGNERTVKICPSEGICHAFSVTTSPYEGRTYIVNFSDISETIAEKMELQAKVLHDNLTGALSREYFESRFQVKINSYQKQGDSAALIMIDIDHFKAVNDTYGHNTGDRILKSLVKTLERFIRRQDRLVRWGGEEFLLLIEVPSEREAMKTAEHLRQVIEGHVFEMPKHITCSFGVAMYSPGESLMDTVERADKAMYKAKQEGRNQVAFWGTDLRSAG